MKTKARALTLGIMGAAVGLAGCVGGDARVEMAAADSMDALAAQLELALGEYHTDLAQADDERQADVVAALIHRLKTDCGQEELSAQHGLRFQEAMARMRQDRETALQRRGAAAENLTILRDTANGLRRVGVASLSLEDETKRYLMDLIAARLAQTPAVDAGAQKISRRSAKSAKTVEN